MPDGIRTNGMTAAAAALAMYERRQQVLANNLANANTAGFKAERTFSRLMDGAIAATETATDRRAGTLEESGNALDLALEGDGFLVVQTAQGERLTRGGSFRLDGQRRLVDGDGNALLGEANTAAGESGGITLPPGTVQIRTDGTVSVNDRLVARLRLESVPANVALEKDGANRYLPPASAAQRTPLAPEARRVRQGFVEASNVNTIEMMTAMIDTLHRYSATQRSISVLDEVRGRTATDIAKPV
ncbi:MAG: flagellar hook-basal body complex protein [Gemmatimonadaceae bacterium]|jgi:flagellar basal body rod protein FlgG|nr:flagellar hook-basal body complex protein [Gemmatimonadaceae bacterium]